MIKTIVGLFSLVSIASSAFAVNRVEDPKYRVKFSACGPKPSYEECRDDRNYYLSQGLITAEEYELMNAVSLYSLHSRDGTLRGFCPCAGDDDPSQSD
jgi:hypothetical protein